MEFVLIHKPVGMLPPEMMKRSVEQAKKMMANPQEFVPTGKMIASYFAIGAQAVYCIWDVPNIEALAPMLRQMAGGGWDTEVVPAEKSEVALANIEKAMQSM